MVTSDIIKNITYIRTVFLIEHKYTSMGYPIIIIIITVISTRTRTTYVIIIFHLQILTNYYILNKYIKR